MPSTTIWDPSVIATTEPFLSQPPNTPVTSVPTIPTVCVAYSTPVVSAMTASSSMNPGAGPSHSQVSSGQPGISSGVIDPAQNAQPSSGPVAGGGPYDAHGQPIVDPNYQGPLFYCDSTGQYL